MNLLHYNVVDISNDQISKTISLLQEQINSFHNIIILLNDVQNNMGIIEAFNFLLSNCNTSYKYFNNILTYLVEIPKYYPYKSIGSETKQIILSSLSQLYLLFKSIIGKSTNIYENSTLETMINIVSISISKVNISSLNHLPDNIESISSQQFLNTFKIILDLLTTIGSPITIHNFQEFNNQISSLLINKFSILSNTLIYLQTIFNKIHEHLNKIKNNTKIELEPNDNLLTISEKLFIFMF
jgi:hypothetical protein